MVSSWTRVQGCAWAGEGSGLAVGRSPDDYGAIGDLLAVGVM